MSSSRRSALTSPRGRKSVRRRSCLETRKQARGKEKHARVCTSGEQVPANGTGLGDENRPVDRGGIKLPRSSDNFRSFETPNVRDDTSNYPSNLPGNSIVRDKPY